MLCMLYMGTFLPIYSWYVVHKCWLLSNWNKQSCFIFDYYFRNQSNSDRPKTVSNFRSWENNFLIHRHCLINVRLCKVRGPCMYFKEGLTYFNVKLTYEVLNVCRRGRLETKLPHITNMYLFELFGMIYVLVFNFDLVLKKYIISSVMYSESKSMHFF